MKKIVHVVASMEWADRRREIQGIRAFSRTQADWQLIWTGESLREQLHADIGRLAGIIAVVRTAVLIKQLSRVNVPVVNISGRFSGTSIPQVIPDQAGVGRVAAEHLLERGYRRFVFLGNPDEAFSKEREKGFRSVAEAGGVVRSVTCGQISSEALLAGWDVPLAVMTYVDNFGPDVIRICRGEGFEVPRDVAVMGVNNDDIFCDLAEVPLSSVDTDAERVGYRAAEVLDGMMRGGPAPPALTLVPPRGVVVRQSSDAFALDDPALRRALEYIQQHACDPMVVKEMLDHVGLCRRTLELRFHAALGRTPHGQIRRIQIEQAKRLLDETDLAISEVGRRSGFAFANRFSTIFHEAVGMPPGRYRESRRPPRREHPGPAPSSAGSERHDSRTGARTAQNRASCAKQ